jgi:hypothetical protein
MKAARSTTKPRATTTVGKSIRQQAGRSGPLAQGARDGYAVHVLAPIVIPKPGSAQRNLPGTLLFGLEERRSRKIELFVAVAAYGNQRENFHINRASRGKA